MKTQSAARIQSLFPVLLASLLVLGTAQLVFDSLKSGRSYVFQFYGKPEKQRKSVFVLPEDRMDDSCNLFEGQWVWDNVSYPLYKENSCPYLVKQTTCLKNGRPDSFYQNWRWQPNACKLPRFDPLKLLDILRDKRLMFIGDSVQRAQFESMVCLVQSVIPKGKKSFQRIPPRKIFKAKEYNASIEYYWAPFIVESNSDHATNHTVLKRLVNLDSISKHGKSWEGVDVLVFESYVWWMYRPQINATYGSVDNVEEYNVTTAYRIALETWANWLESNINPHLQRVFFMSMSPTHLWSWEWKPGSNDNCFNESYPIQGSYWGTGSNLAIMDIIRDILQELKINVTFLNITQLSEYRKDAHTTVFGERRGRLLTKEQRADPKNFADCIHWCLPGVPDTWNEILFAYLLQSYQNFL
ncbi:PREDICTED: protein trichome birefringence-like 31 [Theobroma cacao]|uniref:Protein trichome birefringence-like 31 n=1 Tax=Theobroma cacao TaxID=3641 RepID=A0AB32WMZ1_THECC|nr:PREDICTED: protein trichome birefringence-like 31 [Theobroma cacao]